MDEKEIIKRCDRLISGRTVVQDVWDSIERYVAPYRGKFFQDDKSESEIEWRKPYVYDSTAIMASQSLAAHIHSSLTSPKVKWFDFRYRSPELNEDTEAVTWLDQVSQLTFKALQDSNFNVQAGETYQDLVDFGTSIIVEEVEDDQDFEEINFSSVPIKECFFEQDHKGNVLNFYRKFEWTPTQILSKFKSLTPQAIVDMAEKPETSETKLDIVFCIYRRTDINEKDLNLYRPIPPDNRPFGFKYVLKKEAKMLGEEGGYYEMPAFIPRWRKTSESMWGNSPAMIALSDTLTLNKLVELHINAMEKVIDPVVLTTERGLIGDLDLNPGGLNVVRDLNAIKVFESGARFDVNYQEIQRYRDQIREYFMIDQLMLPPMEGTPATATEIAARISQLEKLIGPTLGRLQSDFLDPLISRTFNILMRGGKFPEPPQSVIDTPSGLDVEYVGALARSQEQDQVNSIDRWIFNLMQLAQVNPDVLDVPNWDLIVKGTGRMLGVPGKFMNSDSKIKLQRDERAAQQQAMMQAEQAKLEGEAAKAQGEAANIEG